LLLASTSPRRRALLEAALLPFLPVPPGPEPLREELPQGRIEEQVLHAAESKARGARCSGLRGLVLGADTVVVHEGGVLGKPADASEAESMLRRLFRGPHLVLTAVAFLPSPPSGRLAPPVRALAASRVLLRDPGKEVLEAYLKGDEWKDKAGAYAIQGEAGAWARLLAGRRDTVVGLPMDRVLRAWEAWNLGMPLPFA